jgi:hypothetical protein
LGIISFLIGLVISTGLIYIITKLLGEREGIKTAFFAAIIGSIVFGITHFLFGNGIIAAFIGGVIWLFSLKWLYDIGWIKSIMIAIIVWIAASIIGVLLPTSPGPL